MQQATIGEGLAQGPYVTARVGFEPAINMSLTTKVLQVLNPAKALNLPLSHHASHNSITITEVLESPPLMLSHHKMSPGRLMLLE